MQQERQSGHVSQDDLRAEVARLDERIKGVWSHINHVADAARELSAERAKALAAAFSASQTAIDKAEAAQIRVNMAQNEFRAALNDASKLQASRVELESIDRRVQAVEQQMAGGSGRAGGLVDVKKDLFSIIALLVSLAVLVFNFLHK